MAPNRAQRVKVAEETLSIADHGHYTSHQKGNAVDLSEQIKEAVANSKVYSVAALGTLRDGLTISEKSTKSQARIVVTDEHAITCCSRLRESHGEEARIGCLNFASAKNVCGGMKGGSLAQEESLGLCSALYPTLSQFQSEYYDLNRRTKNEGVYTDTAIYSPDVPVFREDGNLTLLDEPFRVSFITCPAVNKGRAKRMPNMKPAQIDALVTEVMALRIENVLSIAVDNDVEVLVLGAWGCGVFGNQPEDIAKAFAALIKGKRAKFGSAFKEVVFAVGSDQQKVDVFRRIVATE